MPNMPLINDEDVHNLPGYGPILDGDVHNHPPESIQAEQKRHGLTHNRHTGRRVVVSGHTGTQIGLHPHSGKPYIRWDE
jgi:hypothetical protein